MIGSGILIINLLYLIYYFTPVSTTKKLNIDFLLYSCCLMFKSLNQFINLWLSIGLYNSYMTNDYTNLFIFTITIITSLFCWKVLACL
jgi:hypothetical protein